MSETYPNDDVRKGLSQLESLGYSQQDIMVVYNKCLAGELKTYNDPQKAQIFAIKRVISNLGGSDVPKETRFLVIGYTAVTRFGDSPIKQQVVIAPINIYEKIDPYQKIALEGDECKLVEGIVINTGYKANISHKKFGGLELRSKPQPDHEYKIEDFETYFKNIGIDTLTIPQIRAYSPELNSRGYPKDFKIFNIIVRAENEPKIVLKNDPQVKSRVYNVFDEFTGNIIGVDNSGYPITDSMTIFSHPDHAIHIDKINTFSIVGIISKSKDIPPVYSINSIAVYPLTKFETGLAETSV